MQKKVDVGGFKSFMTLGAKQAGMSVSDTGAWDLQVQPIYRLYRECSKKEKIITLQ